MPVYCSGIAKLRIHSTGEIVELSRVDLTWEIVEQQERKMGSERHHQATYQSSEGSVEWNVWEYPEGAESTKETDANGITVESDFDYGFGPERPDDAETSSDDGGGEGNDDEDGTR